MRDAETRPAEGRPAAGGPGSSRQGPSRQGPEHRQGAAVNVADLVRRAAEATPERTALVSGARHVSWAELDGLVDEMAAGLAGAGLVAGYRVGLALPNTVDFVVAYFGALRGGYVAVPMNPLAPAPEFARACAHTRPRLVLAGPDAIEAVRTAVADSAETLDVLVVPVDVPAGPGERDLAELRSPGRPEVAVVPPADPEALAVLLFTSGTSSAPQAAMLTHRALLANLDQLAAIEPPPVGPDDIVLGLVPFFHVFGLGGVLGAAVHAGARLVLTGRFDPEEMLVLIESEQVTTVPVAPPVLSAWAGRDDLVQGLRGVRLLLSGAAPLPVPTAAEIERATGLTVHEGYGLTEAAPAVTSTLCSLSRRPGSVGSALPGVELRIGRGGAGLGHDDPGEVCVRGANLFSGYWPDAHDGPDPDGWFATGDLGYLGADGDLFLVDRSRELVLVSGFNVYPHEVEETIADLAGVVEVAVVGVPDPGTGETVHAYVVPGPDGGPSGDEVVEHCRRRLARFKCPSMVEIVTALPKSATGKVVKARLRDRHAGGEDER